MKDLADILNKVHNADCLDFMRKLPGKSVDIVITDPPYGINENWKRQRSRGAHALAGQYDEWNWDKQKLDPLYLFELVRVSKKQIIFGGQNYSDLLPPNYGWIFWDKDNRNAHFSDGELAYTSFLKAVRRFKWNWNGMWQENMANKEIRQHPTQKPLPLMLWIIQNFTEPSDIIFDPFLGSGTTAVAAKQLGRNFIGVEINPEYCKIAEERLKQEVLPFNQPQPEPEPARDLFEVEK